LVTIEEIQAAYYMVAATGVLVAAAYYILNLRVSQRNQEISMKNQELMLKAQQQTLETRQTQLSTSITEWLGSKDFLRDFVVLATLDWKDLDDYMKKYDSAVNAESYAQRWTVWTAYDNLGYLLREGLVNKDILFNSLGTGSVLIWGRYKPVIDYYRRRELGPQWLENFEYVAKEMWEMCKTRGYASKDFKGGLTMDRYRDIFEPGFTLSQ
jgi:hypothetical protein